MIDGTFFIVNNRRKYGAGGIVKRVPEVRDVRHVGGRVRDGGGVRLQPGPVQLVQQRDGGAALASGECLSDPGNYVTRARRLLLRRRKTLHLKTLAHLTNCLKFIK